MDITMEDVETAIKVLNEFLRRSREAQMTIRRLEVTTVSGSKVPTSMQDFMNMALQAAQAKQSAQAKEEPAEQVTEEDIRRMREIKDKIKTHKGPVA